MAAEAHFDHAVFAVRDLATAKRRFEKLGFTVLPGGEHAGGWTRNALVALADGSYLELLAPGSSEVAARLDEAMRQGTVAALLHGESAFARHFTPLLAAASASSPAADGIALVDFALVCPQLDPVIERCRTAGIAIAGPVPGERVRPDGTRLAWQLALPDRHDPAAAGLPFLIADETPRALRVPAAPVHPGGYRAVAGMAVEVPDLVGWAVGMEALLGAPPLGAAGSEVTFRLAGCTVTGRRNHLGAHSTAQLRLRLAGPQGEKELTLDANP
jgi:hypothetical protein